MSLRVAETIDELLWARASETPDSIALHYLDDPREIALGTSTATTLTCGELVDRASTLGAAIAAHATPGERALLVLPPGPDYVAAFFGCLRAGVVAVPCNLPNVPSTVERLGTVVADAAASVMVLSDGGSRMGSALGDLAATRSLPVVDTAALPPGTSASLGARDRQRDDVAFLQYTSGSTGQPKGVVVSHANLLANITAISTRLELTTDDREVSWLPPYHDMGLILGILQPLCMGIETVLMSPFAFVVDPLTWLETISLFRGTYSAGPDFAYALAVKRADDARVAALDLSSWRVAVNGAEPIRRATLDQFTARFAPVGFRPTAHTPGYGLAEATLGVAVPAPDEDLTVASPADDATATPTVSVGEPLPDTEVRIVDPETSGDVAEGAVGEIWIAGPGVAGGYWQQDDESAAVFRATRHDDPSRSYLRTGDLGFLHDGRLHVTGRIKDLIIVRGENHYPQDVEETVWSTDPRLRAGCSAAFTVERDGDELLVVVQECSSPVTADEAQALTDRARRAVTAHHGLRLHELVLVEPRAVPKTSAGKVRRRATRAGHLRGDLPVTVGPRHVQQGSRVS